MHIARELGVDDVTPEQIDMVIRAVRDPMIGGWPLIHWEWVFSSEWGEIRHQSRGVEVVGEWPESEDRLVTLRFAEEAGISDLRIPGQ